MHLFFCHAYLNPVDCFKNIQKFRKTDIVLAEKKFDDAYRIRSRAGQHRKKKKQLRFLYLYLLEEIDGPTNLEFQIVSKIFRNPGNMTLCWLKKNLRCVSHQWDYSRTTQKKKKQLHFLYLLEKIDWPCTPQFNQTD